MLYFVQTVQKPAFVPKGPKVPSGKPRGRPKKVENKGGQYDGCHQHFLLYLDLL